MEALREYRKMLKINCLQVKTGHNNSYTFEVRLQQIIPHNLLKFQIVKHREEVVQLYNELQKCIFDFDNPFSKNALLNITKPHVSLLDQINQSLKECLQRIDIIANNSFASFFSIDLHYDDFVSCLKQEKEVKLQQQKQINQQQMNNKVKGQTSFKQKTKKRHSQFERITTLTSFNFDCDIELNSTEILDFTQIRYYQNELLYILQQSKKTTKVRNFFKNMFSQGATNLGYLSIHRKQGCKYIRTQSTELLAEPISMDYNSKTNMLSICTSVGVYVYLARTDKKFQQIQIFTFIELEGTVDFANNSSKAEIYLLRQAQRGQLYVYSINRQETAKTQYKYVNPSSICFEEQHSRLFVSDKQGIHIYVVLDFLQINRLHCVKMDYTFNRLVQNHRFLIGLSERGFMTVLQLKPPNKQQLISVTTNINLPQKTIKIVGSSKNNRLLITNYKNCVTLIDTIEGPFYSFKLRGNSDIKSIFSNKQRGQILVLSVDGHLTVLSLSELII